MARGQIVAAALFTLTPVVAQAQALPPAPPTMPALPAAQVDPARFALGRQLAKLLNPEAAIETMIDRMLNDSMPKAMQADPAVSEMEKAYPGVVKVMIEAMRPILQRRMRDAVPEMWDILGRHYAARLDLADLRAAIDFYSSPTGERIIAGMVAGLNFDSMLSGMVQSGEFEVKAGDMSGTVNAGARKTYSGLPAADRQNADRFAVSPAGRRIVAANVAAQTLMLDWANKPDAAYEAELEAAVIPALEKHTGLDLTPQATSPTHSKSGRTP